MNRGFNGGTICQRRPYNRVNWGVWFTIVHVKSINSQKISLVIQIILNVIQQLLYSCIWLVEHKSLVRTKEENKINYIQKENMVYSEDIYIVYHTFKVLRFQDKEKNVPNFLLLYFPIKTCLFIFHMVLKGFSVLLYIYFACLSVCLYPSSKFLIWILRIAFNLSPKFLIIVKKILIHEKYY